MQTVLDFIQSPLLGQNPILAPVFLPAALKHCAEHMVFLYVKTTVDIVRSSSGSEPTDLVANDDRIKAKFDELLALAAGKSLAQMSEILQPALQIIQQAMQMAQQYMPKPPVDPAVEAVKAAEAETQRKTVADQNAHQIATGKLQIAQQHENDTVQIGMAKVGATQDAALLGAHVKHAGNVIDSDTNRRVMAAKILHGGGTNPTEGT